MAHASANVKSIWYSGAYQGHLENKLFIFIYPAVCYLTTRNLMLLKNMIWYSGAYQGHLENKLLFLFIQQYVT
jgi:hypothetical protein